jgi:hypothetical protein
MGSLYGPAAARCDAVNLGTLPILLLVHDVVVVLLGVALGMMLTVREMLTVVLIVIVLS